MRTFPKSLAALRVVVESRARDLRQLPFEEVKNLAGCDGTVVDSRCATIATIVQPTTDGGIRVVVRGSMRMKWFPFGSIIAVDGFRKFPDETVGKLSGKEFYEFS